MDNAAYKLVQEKWSVSTKVQELMKIPEEPLENKERAVLYKNGKYYHKKQNGVVRISKYEFSGNRDNLMKKLQKHEIEICRLDTGFDYKDAAADDFADIADVAGGVAESYTETHDKESENNTEKISRTKSIWYLGFTGEIAYGNWNSDTFFMEDVQLMNMPLLYKVNRLLSTEFYLGFSPSTSYKDSFYICPTPILIENIPQWYNITNTADLSANPPITWDKKNNILAMRAPFGVQNKYGKGSLNYLCQTLICGFGGIQKQGIKSKVFAAEVHTGNWGCGGYGNNRELMYLAQMIVASVMGIKKLCFHLVEPEAYEQALKKYNLLVNEFYYEELVNYLLGQDYSVSC